MITNVQNWPSASRGMTIFGKRSLKNRKIILKCPQLLIQSLDFNKTTTTTFLESTYQDLSNDISLARFADVRTFPLFSLMTSYSSFMEIF